MNRSKQIIKISIIGILVNVFLVLIKMIIGFLTNSIAIILDAVNNLSDALSSIITIIGTKLSVKAPDKKHPYGYGRIEYISSVTIAIIVLVAGLTSFNESVQKIFNPVKADYSAASIIIIFFAVFIKFFLGRYFKNQGEKVNSNALIASGTEAVFDAFISLSTVFTALISLIFGLSIEGILGAGIALLIVKAGIEILMDTLNSIIGERVDSKISVKLKKKILDYDEVLGAYDLLVHNYGPDKLIGSINIEVMDSMNARAIHILTRRITKEVYLEFGIIITVGIYASNTSDERSSRLKDEIATVISEFNEVIQMHGFYVDFDKNVINFDIIIDFRAEEPQKIRDELYNILVEKYRDYRFDIVLDMDFSD